MYVRRERRPESPQEMREVRRAEMPGVGGQVWERNLRLTTSVNPEASGRLRKSVGAPPLASRTVKLIRDATLVTMIPRKSGPDLVPRVVCLINFTVGDPARVTPDEPPARTT
jgi:hypothetical protein